jgi:Trypsin-like peptidase domain/Sel1 repeat
MRPGSQRRSLACVVVALLSPAPIWTQTTNSSQTPRLRSGSGFAVTTAYVVTNDHVVATCASVRVRTNENAYTAELIAADKKNDLALLKVSGRISTILAFRDNPPVKLGEAVIALGFPLQGIVASSMNLTTGIVSALAGLGDDERALQFSAPIQLGSSGGPLLDQSGNVIGLIASKLSPLWAARAIGDVPQNVNFAIRDTVVRDFLNSRGVQYVTKASDTRLETTDIGETTSKGVALVECLGPMPRPYPAGEPATSTTFQRGLDAYRRHDFGSAFKEWSALAEQGDAPSQFNIGLLFVDGIGAPKNFTEAASWFQRAAEQGNVEAQHNLGAMYASGRGVRRDYVESYKWFTLCAAQGNSGCESQRRLVGRKLSRTQLQQGQSLAAGWSPTKENH